MKFKNLLVHLDPRADNDPALACAMAIAKRYKAHVTLFDVVADLSWAMQFLGGNWEHTLEQLTGTKHKALQARIESLEQSGISARAVLADGRLSTAIVQQVADGKHDLVIKAAEGARRNRSGFIGTTEMRLIRECPCPIMIAKPGFDGTFDNLAAAIDVMDDHELQRSLDKRVIEIATSVTEKSLHLVYAMRSVDDVVHVDQVGSDLFSPEQLQTWQARLHDEAQSRIKAETEQIASRNLQIDGRVLPGDPTDAIAEFVGAHGIDLLVMGTLARGGIDGLTIGNTAEDILDRVDCSVLTTK